MELDVGNLQVAASAGTVVAALFFTWRTGSKAGELAMQIKALTTAVTEVKSSIDTLHDRMDRADIDIARLDERVKPLANGRAH